MAGSKEVGSAHVTIGAKTDGLKAGLKEAKAGLGGFGQAAKSMGLDILSAGAIIGTFTKGLQFVVGSAAEAEVQTVRLNAVLKATGGAAGLSADELTDMASELSNLTGVEDEAIIAAESVMLTFRSLGSDIFPQAMQAAMDLSATMGTDLQSAVVMVGKALQEPIEGVSTLRRVGVMLSDEQEKQVKDFMAVNDVASAQGIILEELGMEFGGVAEAMGDTFQGNVNKLKTSFGNLAEMLGGPVVEGAGEAMGGLVELINTILTYQDIVNEAASGPSFTENQITQADIDLAKSYKMNWIDFIAIRSKLRIAVEAGRLSEDEYSEAMKGATTGGRNLVRVLETLSARQPIINAQVEKYSTFSTKAAGVTEDFRGVIMETTAAQTGLAGALANTAIQAGDNYDRFRELRSQIAENRDGVIELSDELYNLDDAASELQMALNGQLGPEMDNFAETQGELTLRMQETEQEIDDAIAKYGINSEKVAELKGKYAELKAQYIENAEEHRARTAQIIIDLAAQQIMASGLSDGMKTGLLQGLLDIAENWGIVDTDSLTALTNINDALADPSLSVAEFGNDILDLGEDFGVTATAGDTEMNRLATYQGCLQLRQYFRT